MKRTSDKIHAPGFEGALFGCLVGLIYLALFVLLFLGISWLAFAGLGYLTTTGLLPIAVTYTQTAVIISLLVLVGALLRGGGRK